MSAAVDVVEGEVRELVRRAGLDPMSERAALLDLVEAAVEDYELRSLQGNLPRLVDPSGAIRSVMDAVAGFGPLQRYLDDPLVEEICHRVLILAKGKSVLTGTLDEVWRFAGESASLEDVFLKVTEGTGPE